MTHWEDTVRKLIQEAIKMNTWTRVGEDTPKGVPLAFYWEQSGGFGQGQRTNTGEYRNSIGHQFLGIPSHYCVLPDAPKSKRDRIGEAILDSHENFVPANRLRRAVDRIMEIINE